MLEDEKFCDLTLRNSQTEKIINGTIFAYVAFKDKEIGKKTLPATLP